jgi:hypothetical protein
MTRQWPTVSSNVFCYQGRRLHGIIADCASLYQKGILLTNEYGVGAPSQPNYIAPASGDTFGLNSDSFLEVDRNISTIVDLLEDKGISWGDYNEGLPYTGFNGFEYSNPTEGNYARKHNLLQRFRSVTDYPRRQAQIKNFTLLVNKLHHEPHSTSHTSN